MEYYVTVKKKKLLFCKSMDGPEENYVKWIKPSMKENDHISYL